MQQDDALKPIIAWHDDFYRDPDAYPYALTVALPRRQKDSTSGLRDLQANHDAIMDAMRRNDLYGTWVKANSKYDIFSYWHLHGCCFSAQPIDTNKVTADIMAALPIHLRERQDGKPVVKFRDCWCESGWSEYVEKHTIKGRKRRKTKIRRTGKFGQWPKPSPEPFEAEKKESIQDTFGELSANLTDLDAYSDDVASDLESDSVYICSSSNTVGVGGGGKKYTKYLDDIDKKDNPEWTEIVAELDRRFAEKKATLFAAYVATQNRLSELEARAEGVYALSAWQPKPAEVYERNPEWQDIEADLYTQHYAEVEQLYQAWLKVNSPIISTTSAVRCTRIAITYIGIYAALLTINRPRQYARWLWPSPRGPGPPISRDVIVKVDSNFNDLQFSSDILMTKRPEY